MHIGDKPDFALLSLIPPCGPFGLCLKKVSVAAWTLGVFVVDVGAAGHARVWNLSG